MVDKKNVKLRKEIRLITNIADGIIDLSGLAQKITSLPDAVDKTIVAIDVVIQANERCDDIKDISKE